MVKMSDFFKKEPLPLKEPSKEEPKEAKPTLPLQQEPSKIPIKEIQKEADAVAKPVQNISLKDTSEQMLSKMKANSSEETEKLYQDSLSLIKEILDRGFKNEPIEAKEIKAHTEKLVDQLLLENTQLINLTNNFTPENYLYAHSVNVCILSIMLGIGLGYSREQLNELGVAAFLHDIGMVKVTPINQKTGRLSEEEYNKIKSHPIFGVDILEMVKDISQAAIYVAREHHEWANGKGYPQGMKGDQIDEYSRIVATVDSYEALTHPRSYREKLPPFEAIRNILKNKDHFDFRFLKVLIDKIGIFPIGSYVQLNTNETGIVISENKDSPLRPKVKIILDAANKKIEEEKIIDLTANPTIYVKKPVNDSEISRSPVV